MIVGQDTQLVALRGADQNEALTADVEEMSFRFLFTTEKRDFVGQQIPKSTITYNGCEGSFRILQEDIEADVAIAGILDDIITRRAGLKWTLVTFVSPPGEQSGYWTLPDVKFKAFDSTTTGQSGLKGWQISFDVNGKPTFKPA